jgi:hypothetical protein
MPAETKTAHGRFFAIAEKSRIASSMKVTASSFTIAA